MELRPECDLFALRFISSESRVYGNKFCQNFPDTPMRMSLIIIWIGAELLSCQANWQVQRCSVPATW